VRPVVIAFALGAAAVAIVLLVAGFVLGVAADAGGWDSFRIAAGRLVLLEFGRTTNGTTSTTFGTGIIVAAAAGGALNAAAAAFLGRRAR